MSMQIVSTAERPDLAAVTARWRWEAFYRDSGEPYDVVLQGARRTAAEAGPVPRTLVLLVDEEPVATASLTAADLDERPDLSPWLAGVFVVPHARGRGYAGHLVAAVEQMAREAGFLTLCLYTSAAERIYARAGWRTTETFERRGKAFALMRRDLPPVSKG